MKVSPKSLIIVLLSRILLSDCAASFAQVVRLANGVATVRSVSPASVTAGGSEFKLTVNGTGFTVTSTVQWNGNSRTTFYVGPTQLIALITAADVANPGRARIRVVNPASEGGASAVIYFTAVPTNARFVDPSGNDSNPGTMDQPYRTIQRCATSVAAGWTCEVRTGVYRETVTPNSGITIMSFNDESVTIDGSDPLTGWTPYQGSIFKATVRLGTGDTNQVFLGGQMMTEARYPNGDDLFKVNWATAKTGTDSSHIVDSTLPDINWTGAKIHFWSGSDPFSHQTGTVAASSTGQLTVDVGQSGTCPFICPTAGGYYYLFGILGALNAEREWFYDSSTTTLFFWAPGSVNPAILDVRAKQRLYAFDLSGKSNVTIQNVAIFASTINMDVSSRNNILDGINAQYVSHFTTLPVSANDPTGSAYSILGVHGGDSGVILFGSGNILRNSTIAYSAGNGVTLLGDNNLLKNNLIHHVDYIGNYASGISLWGNGNTIQNTTIHTTGRQAIQLFAAKDFSGNIHSNSDDISYNNLFNSMILTRDGGAIYACCGLDVTGTRIHHNWIHDTQSLISGAADNFGYTGVYIDNGAGGFEVDQNVLWNNQYSNINLHGNPGGSPSNANNIHNNSIPDVGSSAYIRLNEISSCGTTRVVDNLVLVPVKLQSVNDAACVVTNNDANSPGANEMTSSVQVGCDFTGCASSGPPAVSRGSVAPSIARQPADLTVAKGQQATFSVTAAGSAPLSYQWQRNSVHIPGATSGTYTTAATTAAEDGAVFTVRVSNVVGDATSNRATLSVK